MQGYDILMMGVMAIAIFRGYRKGLAWQISSIASIVVSYFVAYRFKDRVATMIEIPDPWRGLISMMILFIGSSLVIWFIFQSIRGAIEKAKLKDFDQQLGAIFGGVKGAAWCTAITLVALSFLGQATSQQIVNSNSGGYIARLLAKSKRIIPSEVQQIVQPYIERAENKLQDRAAPNGLPFDPSLDPSVPQVPETEEYWYNETSRRSEDPLTKFSTGTERWQ